MTTATATRTRTAEAAPTPTGPAWSFFASHNPQVDTARAARRWQDATALVEAGHVSAPESDGTRHVLPQNWDSPDRQPGQPTVYTVHIVSRRPRQYECDCADFTFRGTPALPCKHIMAVWQAVYACCAEKQAEADAQAILAHLLKVNRSEFTALLLAVRDHDGKAARTAAARLAGWPARQRNAASRKEEQQPRSYPQAA